MNNIDIEHILNELWPVLRHFLVCGVMLLSLWGPEKSRKTRRVKTGKIKKEGFIDAEYEQSA